ncbi:3-hydroxy-5-methyl-1-naphthoate 3-O-methyltransferase [Paraconexibacter sp. AEG42_29]|uniref:3-hydroxy-5-methyl-1-naphthoate 3-O-methyltransferase n=1 Tax=Paraconexibacter sp. AEG42_29 TaxID=2997339 RepID=A0AAU7B0F5_9ACTN
MRLSLRPDSVPEAVGLATGLVPEPIFDSYVALMQARTLMVAWKVGVFDALADGPAGVGELARRLDVTADGLGVVLPALHALGYLAADGDRFRLSAKGRRTLTAGGRSAVTDWMAFTHDMWDAFDGLEAVLRGGPIQQIHAFDAEDPYWGRYMRGLLQISRVSAADVARAIGAPRRARTLLDVAGGHGGYSMALCRRHRRLRATIVELEGAARIGRTIVAEAGFANRVEHVVADLHADDLPRPVAGYDIALAANILHHLSRAEAVALLRRVRTAMAPGGRVAVFEQERPADGEAGTQIGTLTGVLFHITSGARTCTAGELTGMLVDAGLHEVRVKRLVRAPGQVLVLGRA